MLLDDLLADPSLGLVALSETPATSRVVRDVYVTDLLDPRRYLHGGELVLSGLMWWTGPESSERFVAALAQARVAALASGTARLGYAPRDVVEACERHGVPLVQVPLTISFNVLAERVQDHSTSRRALMSAVASGADLDHVLDMAASQTGADCWVLSAVGALVGSSTELSESARVALLTQLPPRGVTPRAVRVHGEEWLVCAVDADTRPLPPRWWLVLRGDPVRADERAAVATDLVTVVALVRGRWEQARDIASSAAESALHQLFRGDSGAAETVARLDSAGLPAGRWVRVVALSAGVVDVAAALLRELAATAAAPAVVARGAEAALAVFSAENSELSHLDESLRRVLREGYELCRAELVREGEIAVGLSEVTEPHALRAAVEEAQHARRLARTRGCASPRAGEAVGVECVGDRVVSAEELNTHDVLLAAVPEELRDSYRTRLLADLHAYDAAHRSELVHTLRMFLACSGSWSRCARTVHVHVNTLRYRIRRIEQITGRDLGDFRTRVDFHLALRLEGVERD